jgi:hypothetical protein
MVELGVFLLVLNSCGEHSDGDVAEAAGSAAEFSGDPKRRPAILFLRR